MTAKKKLDAIIEHLDEDSEEEEKESPRPNPLEETQRVPLLS